MFSLPVFTLLVNLKVMLMLFFGVPCLFFIFSIFVLGDNVMFRYYFGFNFGSDS